MQQFTPLASFLLPALCLVGIAGCGTETERDDDLGATSQFLEACDADSECGELSCLCGVCTSACDDDDACGSVDGVCAPSDAAACGTDAPAGVCSTECASDDDCEGAECLEGVCNVGQVVVCPDEPARPDCEDATGVYDDDGCLVEWTCPVFCPPIAAPELCVDGSEPDPITDADGCVTGYEECGPVDCPPGLPPEICDDGNEQEPIYDADGCVIGYEECPDTCPDAPEMPTCGITTQPPEPVYDADGCVIDWECTAFCDDPPEMPTCGITTQPPEPVYDAEGCVVDWECTAFCDDPPEMPTCGDTAQPPEPVYDDEGCIVDWFCAGFGPACGEGSCESSEYCEVAHPGPAGPSTYTCRAIPEACGVPTDCECLIAELGPPYECSEVEFGQRVEIAFP